MISTKDTELIAAPPRALDLEEAVTGAAMLDAGALPILAPILDVKHFYDPDLQEIYEAELDLFRRSRPVDLLTVMEELKNRGSLERVGGPARLAGLTNKISSTANTEYHARIITQKWLQRELGKLGNQISRESWTDDPFEVMEYIGTFLNNLSGFREDVATTMYKAAEQVLDDARKAAENPSDTIGFPLFGYKPLDDRLQGVRYGDAGGDMIVITGISGGGKSSLGNNALIQCEMTDTPIYSWSREMTKKDQARRFISGRVGINGVRISKGSFLSSPAEVEQVADTVRGLERKRIYLDSGRMTLTRMASVISYYKRMHGVQIFMFDRIELFDLESISFNSDKAKEDIAKKARQLANDFEVTVVLFAQLRKKDGAKTSLSADLDDIKGASEIVQSATKILYIVRPDMMKIEEDEEGNSLKGIGFIHILKSTHFSRGEVRMKFLETRTRWQMDIDDLVEDEEVVQDGPVPGYNPIISVGENRNFDEDLPF